MSTHTQCGTCGHLVVDGGCQCPQGVATVRPYMDGADYFGPIYHIDATCRKAAVDAALVKAPPPHPLVTLLTEALAVTDPKRPPTEATVGPREGRRGRVCLDWGSHDLSYDGAWWELRDLHYCAAPRRRWTTDPAEARAWLAAALEAT